MTTPKRYSLSQIFLGAASFRHREDFLTLPPDTKPENGEVKLGLTAAIDNERSAAVVTLEASSATNGAVEPLYHFHVSMHAVMALPEGLIEKEDERKLVLAGATFIMPFVREAVASLTLRGRFGPIWLQPVNIQAILEQQLERVEPQVAPTDVPAKSAVPKRPMRKRSS